MAAVLRQERASKAGARVYGKQSSSGALSARSDMSDGLASASSDPSDDSSMPGDALHMGTGQKRASRNYENQYAEMRRKYDAEKLTASGLSRVIHTRPL